MHSNAKDITSRRFGKLIALRPTDARKDGKVVWECRCDCGGVRLTTSKSLLGGVTRSCGCALSEAARKLRVGSRFGRWLVTGYAGRSVWTCRCDCGAEGKVLASNLTSGKSKSCGCLRNETRTVHGMSDHPLYKRWHAMRSRCGATGSLGHEHYAGRGVRVCEAWADFATFVADVGDPPSARHSLDRINVDGDYAPGNVRWATASEQATNKRSRKDVELARATEAELRAALARLLERKAPKSGVKSDQA